MRKESRILRYGSRGWSGLDMCMYVCMYVCMMTDVPGVHGVIDVQLELGRKPHKLEALWPVLA